jgi:MFS family permease
VKATLGSTRIGQLIAAFSMVMAGNGLLLTALGVRSSRAGFSDLVTGAVLGGYYVGFLVGARHARPLVQRFGLMPTLAALVVMMAIVAAGPALGEVAVYWVLLRMVQGYAISASYVVMETFLNGAIGNEHRGRLLGVYMVTTMGAFAGGSYLLSLTGADGATPFVVAGLLTASGAVGLVGLHAHTSALPVREAASMTLVELFRLAPVGVSVATLVGFANGSLTTVAVYGERAGLTDARTALVSAAVGVGPIVMLYPMSAWSDRRPRRQVLVAASVCAAAMMVAMATMSAGGWPMVLVLVPAGGLTIGLYTLASAETNDHVEPGQMAAASGQVVLLYGVGAVLGPFATAATMGQFGPPAYFVLNAVALVGAAVTVVATSQLTSTGTSTARVGVGSLTG